MDREGLCLIADHRGKCQHWRWFSAPTTVKRTPEARLNKTLFTFIEPKKWNDEVDH
jgi:hypothetical protein